MVFKRQVREFIVKKKIVFFFYKRNKNNKRIDIKYKIYFIFIYIYSVFIKKNKFFRKKASDVKKKM